MDRFRRHLERAQSYAAWLNAAAELRASYESDGEPVPEPLASLFAATGASVEDAKVVIIAPRPPVTPPPGSSTDWIWILAHEATPTTLVLAVLRSAAEPIPPRTVTDIIRRYHENVNPGSIANIGTRLGTDGRILRTDGSWSLPHGAAPAPVLAGDWVFGPPSAFETPHEIAAFRRFAIVWALRKLSDGQQQMQITRLLQESCPWLPKAIPVTKDLVKADLQALEELGRVRRAGGHSAKWEATV